jgi:AcrR family transcriptional regulator
MVCLSGFFGRVATLTISPFPSRVPPMLMFATAATYLCQNVNVRLPAHERRRQLLDTALEVFANEGFHATSMNDVADAAGVTKPVLYQHFASKRELYLELLEDVGTRLGQVIEDATLSAGGPHEQVEKGFAAYFRFVHHNRSAYQLLFGGGSRRDAEFAEAVRRVEDHLAESVAGLIQADIDPQHRRTLAYGLVGMAEGTSRFWVAEDLDLDPDVLARQVADLAWAGLRGVHRI